MSVKKLLVPATVILLVVAVIIVSGIQSNKNTTTSPLMTQKEGGLVSDFPNFPEYPNSKLTTSQHNNFTAKPYQPESYQAYYTSKKEVPDVIQWYFDNLIKNGWNIDRMPDHSTPSDQNILASNGNYEASVNVEKDMEGTNIAVSIISTKNK